MLYVPDPWNCVERTRSGFLSQQLHSEQVVSFTVTYHPYVLYVPYPWNCVERT